MNDRSTSRCRNRSSVVGGLTRGVAALVVGWAGIAGGAEPVDFEQDVLPILEAHCVGCHAVDEPEGGLALDSHAALIAGGDSGVVVTPGSAGSSRLWLVASGQLDPTMPPLDDPQDPESSDRLSEQELETLAAWIDLGAIGPKGDLPIKRRLRTPTLEPTADADPPVTAVAFSPDGRFKAVGTYGQVQVRDRHDDRVVTLRHELHKVNSIRFNAAGSRLLVASGVTGAYGNAVLFDIETGDVLAELVGHRDVLYSAALSPDESTIATAGYDRVIKVWDAESGENVRTLSGHNGAVYGLDFSADGLVLVSACADQTVKVWDVSSGQRLDTLSQPEGEVYGVLVTGDDRHILAVSADNRLRVWSLQSRREPQINPLVATRFVDESPLLHVAQTPDQNRLVVVSEAGNAKLIRTSDWRQVGELPPLGETPSDVSIHPDGQQVVISLMNGTVATRELPPTTLESQTSTGGVERILMDLGQLTKLSERELRSEASDEPIEVARGVEISGTLAAAGESDLFQWQAHAGELWAIDADPGPESQIDPIVEILDADHQPVLRVRLQAVRDSYFTFRGKDSHQISDFRLFSWQEMKLNDYLYAAGEVTRLWMHPRGPDSGFNVYPADGKRWTYFGTSHRAHALAEPAFIVRPLNAGEAPVANGLPVFDIFYQNDDDPMRIAGKSSRLLFQAPSDGRYIVRLTDTRGEGGAESFDYRLTIRPANPSFEPAMSQINKQLLPGVGREITFRVDRFDGYDGPVTFEIDGLPAGVVSNTPVTVEAGQRLAVATVWTRGDVEPWEGERSAEVVARATVAGRAVERHVGQLTGLVIGKTPKVVPSVQPSDHEVDPDQSWTLRVRRGETTTARVVIRRADGHDAEVRFGLETAGRNATHGVYVDNIGLNGLLVRAGESEREFFLTADPVAKPGKRSFFLTAQVDGGVTSFPIEVEVLETP